jgi:biopolymer transport protein ExbD
MWRYLLHATIAAVGFCAGVACNNLVNSSATMLIDNYEPACELASSTFLWEEPRLISPAIANCGQLVVTINADGTLYLNQDRKGTLDSPNELMDRVEAIFRARAEVHAYKAGMEATSQVPEEQRIEKTVYIKAERSLRYGEVVELIELLKQTGANPIGLVISSDRHSALHPCGRGLTGC